MWLKDPHGAILTVYRRRALPLVAVFGLLLPTPCFWLLILLPQPVIEVS